MPTISAKAPLRLIFFSLSFAILVGYLGFIAGILAERGSVQRPLSTEQEPILLVPFGPEIDISCEGGPGSIAAQEAEKRSLPENHHPLSERR